MIDKIKTKLIHWLGGYTEAEKRANGNSKYNSGVFVTYCHLLSFADRLYGLSADDWCKRMYQHIEQGVKHEYDI